MKLMAQTGAELAGNVETSRPLIKPWRMDPIAPLDQYANDAGCGCGPVDNDPLMKSSTDRRDR